MTTTQIVIVAGVGLVAVYFLFLRAPKKSPPPSIQLAPGNRQSITGQVESAAISLALNAGNKAISSYFDNGDKNAW